MEETVAGASAPARPRHQARATAPSTASGSSSSTPCFNADNLGELTSMYGIAAKLTEFLAGWRIKLLTEGVSNAENNFNIC